MAKRNCGQVRKEMPELDKQDIEPCYCPTDEEKSNYIRSFTQFPSQQCKSCTKKAKFECDIGEVKDLMQRIIEGKEDATVEKIIRNQRTKTFFIKLDSSFTIVPKRSRKQSPLRSNKKIRVDEVEQRARAFKLFKPEGLDMFTDVVIDYDDAYTKKNIVIKESPFFKTEAWKNIDHDVTLKYLQDHPQAVIVGAVMKRLPKSISCNRL